MSPRPLLVLALALLAGALLAPSAQAEKTFGWLCRPDHLTDNPCTGSLTATRVDVDGKPVGRETKPVPAHQPIDCFYVYPTVSSQPTTNADLSIDPEQIAIAQQQANRFKESCKIYAPVYRQLTIAGIFDPSAITAANSALAYAGVRDAWRSYLKHDNHGRGFVLLGHSQGSFVLRQLIRSEIDRNASVRRRLVSAVLLGGNVLVKKGSDRGGDFQNIPACRRDGQTGCVVAYSMFNATPPKDASFGRVDSGFDGATGARAKRLQVLCTNPAALSGGSARLHPYARSEPFPGTLGIAVNAFIGPLPAVDTPWIIPGGRYDARCSTAGGASVLLVKASQGARDFVPSPDPGWGWHLGDANLALGDLTKVVAAQERAYVAAH